MDKSASAPPKKSKVKKTVPEVIPAIAATEDIEKAEPAVINEGLDKDFLVDNDAPTKPEMLETAAASTADESIADEISDEPAGNNDVADEFGVDSDKAPEDFSDVPKVDLDAPLNIESLTEEKDVPVSDKNAKLKFEDEGDNINKQEEKSAKKLIFLGAFGFLLTIAVLAVFSFLFIKSKPEEQIALDASQPAIIKTADASPKAVLDKDGLSFEVLNGSGVAGAAKIAAIQVDELGYKVIKTGNADKQDYEKTALLVSKEFTDKEKLILEDLKGTFASIELVGELKDSTASARIIIGKD